MPYGTIGTLMIFFSLFFSCTGSGRACTIFMTCRGGQVLVGNNEDWIDSHSRLRFVPAAPAHMVEWSSGSASAVSREV